VTFASAFALFVLCGFGEFSRRIVGILYYHPEKKLVKLSHPSFLGQRVNTVHVQLDTIVQSHLVFALQIIPLEDVIPISETSENPRNVVWAMRFYGQDAKTTLMYMCTAFGGIKHVGYFRQIFGEEGEQAEDESS